MRTFFLSLAVALLLTLLTPPVWAGAFTVPSSVAALSEAGALVADSQPVSSYAVNPAGMAFFAGNRGALEILATRPTVTFQGPTGDIGAQNNTGILADLYLTHRFSSLPLSVGLGITSPYYFHNNWAADTLPTDNPALQNQLRIIDIDPSVAYLLLPDLSVAVGLDYYQSLGGKFGTLGGNGSGVGGHVGLLYSTEGYNIGLSYRSPASLSAAGGKIQLPGKLQAGLRYRWTPSFATELDVDWTDWQNAQLPYYGDLGWKSSLAYRLGLSFHLNQDLEIRGGIAHEGSPAGGQAIQLAYPATSSNLAAFGLGIGLGPWHYDLGASYVFSGSAGGSSFSGGGFSIPAASYKSSNFLVGVGLSRRF